MVEKPKPAEAPSNLIITGRYILQPEIFDLLETQQTGAGGEIQLTDAMLRLLETQPFYGFKFEGRTFDCGSKLGFLTANVAYALARDDIAPAFAQSEFWKHGCSHEADIDTFRYCTASVMPSRNTVAVVIDARDRSNCSHSWRTRP